MNQIANQPRFNQRSRPVWNTSQAIIIMAGGFLLAWTAFWLHTMIVRADSPAFNPSSPGFTEADRETLTGRGGLTGNPAVLPYASSSDGRFWVFPAEDRPASGDINSRQDIFLYDQFSGKEELISSARNGLPAEGDSGTAAVSGDGRRVVFSSRAGNLTKDAAGDRWQIFVKDREGDEVRRITTGLHGETPDGDSYYPSISADGRRAAFVSFAENLVKEDGNGVADVFLSDLETGEIRRISDRLPDGQDHQAAYQPVINAAGNAVVYVTRSQSDIENVFYYDVDKDETSLISAAPDGTPAAGGSWMPSISADGMRVVFSSYAGNVIPNDANGVMDVFLYERGNGKIKRVSTQPEGDEFSLMSWRPALSADGRYVRFETLQSGSGSTPADDNGYVSYLYDGETGEVRVLNEKGSASAPGFISELASSPSFVQR